MSNSGLQRSIAADGERESVRRSAEAERGQRRSAEGERKSAEGQGNREGNSSLQGFKPQTQREAALYQMILQLQREVAELRRSVQTRNGSAREGNESREGFGDSPNRPDSSEQTKLPARWKYTKEGKVFITYDKNGDQVVTLDEWLAMTNGNVSAARREVQTKRFREAEPSGDNKFTPAEFIYWYSRGRFENTAEGRNSRARDGEGSKQRPRDGEGARRGQRDGE